MWLHDPSPCFHHCCDERPSHARREMCLSGVAIGVVFAFVPKLHPLHLRPRYTLLYCTNLTTLSVHTRTPSSVHVRQYSNMYFSAVSCSSAARFPGKNYTLGRLSSRHTSQHVVARVPCVRLLWVATTEQHPPKVESSDTSQTNIMKAYKHGLN